MRTSSDLVADFKRDHADIYNYVDGFFSDDLVHGYPESLILRFRNIFDIYDYEHSHDFFIWDVAETFLNYLKFYDLKLFDEKAGLVDMLFDIERRKYENAVDYIEQHAVDDIACNFKLSVSDATLSKFDQLKKFLKKDYEDDGILVFPFDNDFAFDVMIEMLYSHFIDKSDVDLLESKSELEGGF